MDNEQTIKTCGVCKQEKPTGEFVPGRNKCRDCHNAYYREYWKSHPEGREKQRIYQQGWRATPDGKRKMRKKNREYYILNRATRLEHTRKWRFELWDGLLEKYGRACSCCGETERLFLTIDHVNRDGAADRAKHGGHHQLYSWLSKQSKLDGYQTLCFNCNCGRERNGGICPHVKRE